MSQIITALSTGLTSEIMVMHEGYMADPVNSIDPSAFWSQVSTYTNLYNPI
jgi:hypothetical protein